MTNPTLTQIEIEKIITDLNNQVKDCTQAILKLREVNALLGVKVDLPNLSNLEKYAEINKLNSIALYDLQDPMKIDNVVLVKGSGKQLNLYGAIQSSTQDMTLRFKIINGKINIIKGDTNDVILFVSAFHSEINGWQFGFDGKKPIEVKRIPTSNGEMLLIQF